jgi:glycosyltransferase involved in cell wall biosynthesis
MPDLSNQMKRDPPKISIGLVVYNGAGHIKGALDSIVRQTYKNIELVVVDGGSIDGTQNILSEYAEHISVMVSEPDKGIYDAMNKVCSLATGDWLIFLGCDDVLLDTIGNIADLLTDPDSVYYGDVILSSSGKFYGGKFSKYRLAQVNFCHQAMFYPRSVYKKYSYSLHYRWLSDYVYNLKLSGDAVPFAYAGVVVSIYNDQGGSSQGDAEFEKGKIRLIRSSLGAKYALFEILRRGKEAWVDEILMPKIRIMTTWPIKAWMGITWAVDKTARVIGFVLKRLLPYSYWKRLQSMWRWMLKKY